MRETPVHTKVLALIGIAALVLQLNAVPFEAFLFHLNQAYIAKNLCEHKVPHCNGHCFLMKQMAKSSNAAKDKNSERSPLDGHFLPSALSNLTVFPASQEEFLTSPGQSTAPGWQQKVLQPPRFS